MLGRKGIEVHLVIHRSFARFFQTNKSFQYFPFFMSYDGYVASDQTRILTLNSGKSELEANPAVFQAHPRRSSSNAPPTPGPAQKL